jgi:RimJ/RimL family protein N-acetyltransferase
MNDLVIRPLTAGEAPVFESLADPLLTGPGAFGHRYRDRAARGEYRPEWTWIALRGDTVVARAAWWAGPNDDTPVVLDWLDFTDAGAAEQLLRTAPLRTEYCLRLPAGWRDTPAVARAAQARITMAQAAGLTWLVERNNYRWTPEHGLPTRPGRLEFRPEPDDAVILDVFRRVQEGSLDAHARQVMAASGLDAAAQEDLDNLRWMPSPRDWWRLAYTSGGELVGLTAPCRNYHDPVIGHIAVVPGHRGHGYSYDLLAEATHFLAGEGADWIVADTDVTNTPMAATFAKAHYPVSEQRVYLAW